MEDTILDLFGLLLGVFGLLYLNRIRIITSLIRFIVEHDPDKLSDPFFKRICLKYPEFHYLYIKKDGETELTFIGKENILKGRNRAINQFGRIIELGGKRKFSKVRNTHRKS